MILVVRNTVGTSRQVAQAEVTRLTTKSDSLLALRPVATQRKAKTVPVTELHIYNEHGRLLDSVLVNLSTHTGKVQIDRLEEVTTFPVDEK